MRFRTLLFLGFMAAAPALSGCIIESDGSGSCLDNQFFLVEWEVDDGATMFLCNETPPSRVDIVTNANQTLPLFDVRCDNRQGVLYNWSGVTQGGIPVGTTVVSADLISTTNGATLSFVDLLPSEMVPISACQGVNHKFEFPIQ